MKKTGTGIPAVLLCLAFLFAYVCLSACVRHPAEAGEEAESVQKTEVNETPGTEQDQASENAAEGSEKSEQAQASENAAEESEETKQETARRIRVTAGETVVVYELGRAVSGSEAVGEISGTVQIEQE